MDQGLLVLRVICVRTGDKYNQWYEDNLKHMIDQYSGLEYDEFVCIRDDIYDDERGVFNKLQMFDRYRDGQNIYFDLDILIRGDCNHFLRDDFTLCHAWWRDPHHTPLNSSIVSWKDDASHVLEPFLEDPEYNLFKYNKGMDQYIYENVEYKTYSKEDDYCSYRYLQEDKGYRVYLFNQRYEEMKKDRWYSSYFYVK